MLHLTDALAASLRKEEFSPLWRDRVGASWTARRWRYLPPPEN